MPTPTLHAVVSSPANGVYQAVFRYLGVPDYPQRENHAFPNITIPCLDYAHACAVVSAFNAKGQ